MSNLVGQTLSHYRVTSAIGAGGMGQVYRATDTTLDREVAIKVLPPDVASDPERLARFRREAHLLASLNHPNIAAIYGLQDVDGTSFIALELVEGEDLKDRLARGPIPVDEAIDIATQVAEALEEAHNRGIVHRDLKPANVKLSHSGRVKVLDFGLAKAWASDASTAHGSGPMVSQSPTLAHDGTLSGVVLGTAAYMAPEQARGKPVDRRADVWAFGVLLWEMLTGRSMYEGETVTDVIAAVVTRDPDLTALPANTPPALRRLIAHCLRKNPRQRLPDIGTARLELQEMKSGAGRDVDAAVGAPAAIAPTRSARRERLAWGAALLVTAAVAGALAFAHFREKPPAPQAAVQFMIDPPPKWEFAVEFGAPVPSPDGRQIVFRATQSGVDARENSGMLWTRALDSLASRPLPGTEGAYLPAWSPDGTSIAFATADEVRTLGLAAGRLQRVCALPKPGVGGIAWLPDGRLLFSTGAGEGELYVVPASGGEAKRLTPRDASRGETYNHLDGALPDGSRFLFAIEGDRVRGVYLGSLAEPARRTRIMDRYFTLYASGHLLFARDGTLFAQPFDAAGAAVSGDPVAIATSVAAWSSDRRFGWFGASPAGTVAYLMGPSASLGVQLAWVDRTGASVGRIGASGGFGQIALSPDGRNAVVEVNDENAQYDLWVMDLTRGVMSRVTAGKGSKRDPVWSPDGRSVAYISRLGNDWRLERRGLSASETPATLARSPGPEYVPEFWRRDGRLVVIRRDPTSGVRDGAYVMPATGGEAARVVSGVEIDEPQVSPDERWIAYVSRESGQEEVYVEPLGQSGSRVRVSTQGGGQPKWRADGRELFFVTTAGRLATVQVKVEGDRFDVSLPVDLFALRSYQGSDFDDYAPASDGQRFLVKLPVEDGQKPRIGVITNWTSLLR